MRLQWISFVALVWTGCSGSDNSSKADMQLVATDGGSMANDGPLFTLPDAGVGVGLQTIAGRLTYSATINGETNIYTVGGDGSARLRLTASSDHWSYHSVSPDRRFIVAVQEAGADAQGRPDISSRGTVWILDIRTSDNYRLTPDNCDAGIGGVAWLDDAFVTFAMKCGDEPSKGYLASFQDRSRDPARMLIYADHMFPVRDISTAIHTSKVVYVVDQERCIDGRCVPKPQLWVADTETMLRCQVTDGDRDYIETTGHIGAVPRVGDHNPVFTDQLRGLVFTRNVANKPVGPSGHHDIHRVGLNLRALDANEFRCELPGTEVNLSDEILGDDPETIGADGVYLNELFPQPAIGDEMSGDDFLFVGRDPARIQSRAYVTDIAGGRRALSLEGEWVVYARWITSDLNLTGER